MKNRLERIITSMPFRMAVGRFGIRLAEFGRALQTRYANWNSEFRLKHQFFPNSEMCALHVSEQVTTEMILSFDSPDWQPKKMTSMVRALFDIKGVVKVHLNPYEVTVTKGRVFSWGEILPKVERVLLEHLTA